MYVMAKVILDLLMLNTSKHKKKLISNKIPHFSWISHWDDKYI
jgi:hypothetical protein